ncbi:(DL)-glycerol-3-phosphatase 1, mitochondrial-like [Primulina eburnea]|uniref:(DL)-glycerol-3-phosphatase 1, mitochondrial-like n=1 Tax=Primulina eburnea TaxID=1245227 RepID=UPI003C6CC092
MAEPRCKSQPPFLPAPRHSQMANPGGADDTPSTKPSITHVIFDTDGLSLGNYKLYTEVHEIILSRYSKTFDWSLKAKMMGASRLILHLHATGIPICVATGS